eukprot:gnl/TRDRNA2_/TRDRNA2_117562_c0_seq1.p1 gnl/TRDRNA2_/TRDRNA2_117562_c0~~gnl/TRDRNA2_/TRDRNA2_117562_c0_seq1.p1  ORF type:complete len:331 (+),score=57.50 gnl/TRDRNA2_/TRDRNA2_117562_c0_seq1:38-994(+)
MLAELPVMEQELKQAKNQLHERDAELANLHAMLAGRDQVVDELQAQLGEARSEIKTLQGPGSQAAAAANLNGFHTGSSPTGARSSSPGPNTTPASSGPPRYAATSTYSTSPSRRTISPPPPMRGAPGAVREAQRMVISTGDDASFRSASAERLQDVGTRTSSWMYKAPVVSTTVSAPATASTMPMTVVTTAPRALGGQQSPGVQGALAQGFRMVRSSSPATYSATTSGGSSLIHSITTPAGTGGPVGSPVLGGAGVPGRLRAMPDLGGAHMPENHADLDEMRGEIKSWRTYLQGEITRLRHELAHLNEKCDDLGPGRR